MDMYGVSLLHSDESSKQLAKNTVLQYFGNVKNWFYDLHPFLVTITHRELLKISHRLEKFASKRHDGAFVKKAPALTSLDLKSIIEILYSNATTEVDYIDAGLLSIMWYFFGRSSDTHMMKKEQLQVLPGGVMFFTFERMKTSLVQGLSFFKHKSQFLLCPVHSLAVAMVMQEDPSSYIVKCSATIPESQESINFATLITEQIFDEEAEFDNAIRSTEEKKNKQKTIGIYAYVDRILLKVYNLNKVNTLPLTPGLSSQFFRRGAAQHANANPELCAQWIGDRGGWQMSGMNKAFAYIFNTTKRRSKSFKAFKWMGAHRRSILT